MDTGAGVYAVLAKTLSKLISLSDDRFQELIDDGTINPKMGRNDMSEPNLSKKCSEALQPRHGTRRDYIGRPLSP